MITYAREEIRLKAVKKIFEYRECNNNNVRVFIKPKVNFNANEYFNLISDDIWLESILTHHISTCIFIEYLNSTIPILSFTFYISYTQNVERHIRIVSQTSKDIV